ncbi:S-layer glycoprotein N-glycosyltransferase AglJ [Natronomonas gomsonensis]|jgi:glycosyltransferase (TIGR04182 family)|uniref:S-layer glycoprotein N-glycosyltransferase AglJ n=1 Tax=Natronomonas gomsonensis TaxID=1046043 RepID=UPI0020CA8745|nr:S-layer glycoprotein N-glycosyltransferase AglJ [Natronomonas gomsonensis]MCY4729285.1 S-layer glycoprotein N-glycosyltransferase AglJ [Natronomonas gomsonensis]
MPDLADVCVLLPTLNEAETIGDVIDGFRAEGFEHVLVVDGDSTDGTRDIAREHGARVLTQSGSGKGQAVREGVEHVEEPYVLMADGDGTYRPEDAEAMLEPLFDGRTEHVIGNRFADMEDGAMSRLNTVGNRLINRLFAAVHGRNLRDILSGYRAFTRSSFERFQLDADGFGIETELAVECIRQGVSTEVVPIRYEARPGGSETNLHPLKDGGRIVLTLYTLTKTNNPIFYFGSVAVAGTALGTVLAAYVGYDYFVRGISHEVIALLSVFFILLSMQLLMFGVLSDIIVSVNREQTRRLEEISDRLRELED